MAQKGKSAETISDENDRVQTNNKPIDYYNSRPNGKDRCGDQCAPSIVGFCVGFLYAHFVGIRRCAPSPAGLFFASRFSPMIIFH
jgi:hypothetical protein